MTYTMTDGVLGLEGVWTWLSPPDWGINATLNDLSVSPPTTRVKIVDVVGLFSGPESEDNRRKRLPQGEAPLSSDVLGKTITIEAAVEAMTLSDLRPGVKALGDSFLIDRDNLGTMRVKPHPEYAEEGFSDYWQCRARVVAFDAGADPDYQPNRAWPLHQTVTIALNILEGRWYWSDSFEGGSSPAGPTEFDLENTGSAPTEDGTVKIHHNSMGSGGSLTIFNDTIEKQLVLTNLPALAEGYVSFDFGSSGDPRQIRHVDTVDPFEDVDLMPYLNLAQSNWWDRGVPGIVPGENHLRRSGGHSLTAGFKPAAYF